MRTVEIRADKLYCDFVNAGLPGYFDSRCPIVINVQEAVNSSAVVY